VTAVANVSKAFDTLTQLELAGPSSPRLGTSRYLIWLFVGVLLISAAVIFLRHNGRGAGDNRQAAEITSEGKEPGILSPGSIVEQSTSALAATLPWDRPGFVLQVAAMMHEDNAEALAETLRQTNFPAFVFKRSADPFYRVAIGVYGDADSAVRVKDELERQGFKAILRRWIPE
jgi:sporulation related protein